MDTTPDQDLRLRSEKRKYVSQRLIGYAKISLLQCDSTVLPMHIFIKTTHNLNIG